MTGSTRIDLVNLRGAGRTEGTELCLPISSHAVLRPHILQGTGESIFQFPVRAALPWAFFNWKCVNSGTLPWAVEEEILE